MAVIEIVDGEKLLSNYLRTHPDVSGLTARLVGKTPDDTSTAWVKVQQLNAQDMAPPLDHLTRFVLQLDCYAGGTGGQPEANRLARVARAAIRDLPGIHAEGTVTGVGFTGHARIPDVDFDPPRERVVVTAVVYAHP